jgi:hypothetical protein
MAILSALTDTWNNVLTAWTAIKMNVADSASSADSKLLDLQINGAPKASVTKAGAVLASPGTLAAPGFSFIGDDGTGIYGPSVGAMSFALNEVKVLDMTALAALFATPIKVPIGTVAAPSITSSGTGNAGVNFFTGDSVSIVAGGQEQARFLASGAVVIGASPSTATLTPGVGNTSKGIVLGEDGFVYLSSDSDPTLSINRNTSSGTIVTFNREGTTVGSISVATSSVAYNTTSDYRIKDRAEPPQGYDLDAEFARLANDLTWFAFKSEPGVRQLGWMAHEFGQSVPLGVTGRRDAVDENGMPILQQIDQSKAIPLIVARLGLLVQQVATLQDQLAELRGDE